MFKTFQWRRRRHLLEQESSLRELSHINRPIHLLNNKIDQEILNEIDMITLKNKDLIDP